jgi:hypothetical protein
VVALTSAGRVLAFEAKLKDWREALHQAYRNSCFANGTYVVLPKSAAELAHHTAQSFKALMSVSAWFQEMPWKFYVTLRR